MNTHTIPGVRQTYSGKHVVLIGATGFLGKVIVEKLLREAPDLDRITLLVRGNRNGDSPAVRLDNELLNTPLLRHLRETVGADRFAELVSRIVAVTADITRPRLGLEDALYRQLADSADIIINSAASVNFREALDQALHTNMHAADRLANFAEWRGIPILHISTCYVNSFNRGLIAEANHAPRGARLAAGSIGELPGHGYYETDAIIGDLEHCVGETAAAHCSDPRARSDAMVELGQQKAREYGWNDCYTMTKWLAEQRLLARRPNGQLTILRPSIIESTWMQPFGGWLEGIKVADAVIYAYAKRRLSVFPGHKDRIIDVIPADMVANSTLLAGAELLAGPPQTRIYQCSSGTSNPLTIGQLRDHVVSACQHNHAALPKLFARRPGHGLRILPPLLFNALTGMLQTLMRGSALLFPSDGTASQREVRFGKMKDLVSLYAYYASPDYVFCNRRLQQLHSTFSAEDRERLPVDAAGLDWQTYIASVHLPGLHRYALRGSESRKPALPAATTTTAAAAADAN